jgi:hypothetical protein
MTEQHFIDLQKAIYNTSLDDEWQRLFDEFNKKNNRDLSIISRNDHIIILKSIALKQGFKFHPTDIEKHSPITRL